jgi:RimJ/RimL family protein N-acetyltransferase
MIATERLVLRPWQDADKARYSEVINTPAVMALMGGVATREDADRAIDAHRASQEAHGMCFWAVARRDDGVLIGMCGLRYGGHPGTGIADELEIGWRFAEAEWGKGYAGEAARASIDWGWANTRRNRIAAWTVPANRPSWRLMIRLGMTARPDLDFDHPRFPPGHPLRRHVVYVIERPPRPAL